MHVYESRPISGCTQFRKSSLTYLPNSVAPNSSENRVKMRDSPKRYAINERPISSIFVVRECTTFKNKYHPLAAKRPICHTYVWQIGRFAGKGGAMSDHRLADPGRIPVGIPGSRGI